jgi:hypothetical protein
MNILICRFDIGMEWSKNQAPRANKNQLKKVKCYLCVSIWNWHDNNKPLIFVKEK